MTEGCIVSDHSLDASESFSCLVQKLVARACARYEAEAGRLGAEYAWRLSRFVCKVLITSIPDVAITS
jgi:hypothetical protein